MPRRSAIDGLPPTAKIARPINVRSRMNHVTKAATTSTRTVAGRTETTPFDARCVNNDALPKASIAAGIFMKSAVPTKVSRKLRITYCVPIVTISDGACNFCTRKPFRAPKHAPPKAANTRMSAIGISGNRFVTSIVSAYMTKAAIAVNETSIPPDASTTSTPMANRPRTTDARRMSTRLLICRKSGLAAITTKQVMTVRKSVNSSGLAPIRSQRRSRMPRSFTLDFSADTMSVIARSPS